MVPPRSVLGITKIETGRANGKCVKIRVIVQTYVANVIAHQVNLNSSAFPDNLILFIAFKLMSLKFAVKLSVAIRFALR